MTQPAKGRSHPVGERRVHLLILLFKRIEICPFRYVDRQLTRFWPGSTPFDGQRQEASVASHRHFVMSSQGVGTRADAPPRTD